MIRFKLLRLLQNREERENRRISWKEVSEATGISPTVLSNLASPRPGAVTNSRYIETLVRYFRCGLDDLIELVPPLDGDAPHHVDELYPRGAEPEGNSPE
jgi:DNA-binding Xre family transcriptional regulator